MIKKIIVIGFAIVLFASSNASATACDCRCGGYYDYTLKECVCYQCVIKDPSDGGNAQGGGESSQLQILR